MIKRRCISNNP